jgi:putative ABC transport system substrate-binding protein
MRRREFLGALGGAAAAWPRAARAQQQVPVIGFLTVGTPVEFADRLAAFRDGLRKSGYVEGRNVAIEYRWGDPSRYDRVSALAAELVDRQVNVIAVGNVPAAAKAATASVPIVSLFGGDPVKSGLVASLNAPGGNITGVGLFAFSLGTKRLQLLRETVPNTKVIAILANPTQPDLSSKDDLQEVEATARTVGQKIAVFNASSEANFEPAFSAMVREQAGALLVMADPFFFGRRDRLILLAARHSIPAIWEWREMALGGGLMSYGSSITDAFRLLGGYAAQVLNGAKPSDLPVQQQVKIELVLNLKTAKTLGIEFPLTLLGRADEVIE